MQWPHKHCGWWTKSNFTVQKKFITGALKLQDIIHMCLTMGNNNLLDLELVHDFSVPSHSRKLMEENQMGHLVLQDSQKNIPIGIGK